MFINYERQGVLQWTDTGPYFKVGQSQYGSWHGYNVTCMLNTWLNGRWCVLQGSHSHGKAWKKILSWKMGKKNKVMEILKKSWNFFTADHDSRTRSSDNSISTGLLQWLCYGRLSVYVLDFQFEMLGGRQTLFLTPYFQFEKRFDFLFVYVMNTCDYFLCLPSWHHGKRRKLSWKVMEKSWNYQIFVGTLVLGKQNKCNFQWGTPHR